MYSKLMFLYNNYMFYFILLAGLLASAVTYLLWARKKYAGKVMQSSFSICVDVILVSMVAVFLKHHGGNTIDSANNPYVIALLIKCLIAILIGVAITFASTLSIRP